MTTEEDKERGNLTITVNYFKFAQSLNNAIHMFEKVRDQLEIAAIEKRTIGKERRNGDRKSEN